jgi:hypothetical protein
MWMQQRKLSIILLMLMAVPVISPAAGEPTCTPVDADGPHDKLLQHSVRLATFNVSLNRQAAGRLLADMQDARDQLSGSDSSDKQIKAVAEIIQRVRPDILLLNEFDYDEHGEATRLFMENYLRVSQNGQLPIDFEYHFLAAVNTGVGAGVDLNNDGRIGGPEDSYGYGEFPGQYGMVVLSRFPIITQDIRTFSSFLWKDMPGALLPDDPATAGMADWYSNSELELLRLSSKSHWDVPVRTGASEIHVLVAHPTPPGFDGAEDRNGRRNHDEIRFWADYVRGDTHAGYIYDDLGSRGGLADTEQFVILGDYNADIHDGDSYHQAIAQLLNHPRINSTFAPASAGAIADSLQAKQVNALHKGDSSLDTADFNPAGPGNLRVDYVLPSANIEAHCGGVFWPAPGDDTYYLTGPGYPVVSSDHHLVWLDVILSESR